MTADLEAGLWGALLGAVAGGLVSFFSERMHDSRRRRQTLVDQFADMSFDFVAVVQTYWSANGQDNQMQASIIAGINKIRAKLVQLGFDLVKDSDVRLLLKEVYQLSSGGSFASKVRTVDPKRGKGVEARMEALASIVVRGKSVKTWK